MTRKLMALLLGAGTMVYAVPALAQTPTPGPHFTFTVPLRLLNLAPEITGYVVSCSVFGPPAVGLIASAKVDRRGWSPGATDPAIRGSLVADVVVQVTVTDAFKDPALATNYACNLQLSSAAAPRTVLGLIYLDDAGVRFPLAPGAPRTTFVTGLIP